jgi:hypothetical protein
VKARLALRSILFCVVLFAAVSGLYWLKTAADINLFRHFSLSRHLPSGLLPAGKPLQPEPGETALDEDFEGFIQIPARWHKLVAAQHSRVQSSKTDCESSSRCMVVVSDSDMWWHITDRYFIAVHKGDLFQLDALVSNAGEGGYGEIQLSAFGPDYRLIKRDYWCAGAASGAGPTQVSREIVIPEGVAFVQLRMAGRGRGKFQFDDIRLVRQADKPG